MSSLNGIDYLILFVLLFYAYEGYASGFIGAFLDLVSFVLAFLIGLRFYGLIANILVSNFSMPPGFADAIGFFIVVFIVQTVIGVIIRKFFKARPKFLRGFNRWFGILPGILSGAILVAFILVLIITLPVSSPIKKSISASYIGNLFLSQTQGLEKELNKVLGGAISETINFLTVEPKSNEIVSLNFKTKNFSPDEKAERYMFSLINKERKTFGLKEVIFDDQLRDVGRAHCKDMFEGGYFSHFTPEGFSPFDRMDDKGIIYNFAGENLALSPNTDIAMQGLMNSPGHKANILSTDFGRVGIGVIDGGIYGEMFCQEFTD